MVVRDSEEQEDMSEEGDTPAEFGTISLQSLLGAQSLSVNSGFRSKRFGRTVHLTIYYPYGQVASVDLAPENARSIADELDQVADKVEQWNREDGLPKE